MKSTRVHVEQGVSIYRRFRVWWIDVRRNGERKRWNLHTEARDHALVVARELAAEILSGRWNIAVAGVTTFERAVTLYQTEYEPLHHAPKTIKLTKALFVRFGEFVRNRHGGHVTLDQVRREDLEAYQRVSRNARSETR